jgi:hypothetical protein
MAIRPHFYLKQIAPAENCAAIVADSTAPFESLYVGGGGNVRVLLKDGSSVTFNSVGTGTFMPVTGVLVKSSATTATNLVGLT